MGEPLQTAMEEWRVIRPKQRNQGPQAGRVEDWRGVPKVWPSLLLPVSVGSASIAEP
jgi:hypothetical protein